MEIKKLIAVAAGEIHHIYNGLCPDSQTGANSRDDECPACQIIIAAETESAKTALRATSTPTPSAPVTGLLVRKKMASLMPTLSAALANAADERRRLKMEKKIEELTKTLAE